MKELSIGQINPNLQVPEIRTPQRTQKESGGPGFGDFLKDAISAVNEVQRESDLQVQRLMAGESQDLHETLIAVQRADLTFQMMMQVRNKILQAYNEIMRMPM
jgi:flagellar hook-basal body complex protein FliE